MASPVLLLRLLLRPPPWRLSATHQSVHVAVTPLLLLLLVGNLREVVSLADGADVAVDHRDDAKQGHRGLAQSMVGLPAGITTLLKFRSSLPLAPLAGGQGGQAATSTTVDPNQFVRPPVFPQEESWPGSCRLRSKRYVSDGLCVSSRPVNEVVCAVSCVMNAWSKEEGTRPLPWRCSDSGWKRQRVRLLCRDGSTRSYRIRVVQKCRCFPRRSGPGPGSTSPGSTGPTNQLE